MAASETSTSCKFSDCVCSGLCPVLTENGKKSMSVCEDSLQRQKLYADFYTYVMKSFRLSTFNVQKRKEKWLELSREWNQ